MNWLSDHVSYTVQRIVIDSVEIALYVLNVNLLEIEMGPEVGRPGDVRLQGLGV